MVCNFASLLFVMLFASDVWAVYGIGLPAPHSVECEDCQITSIYDHVTVTKSFETPVPALSIAATTQPHYSPLVTPPAAPPVDLNDSTFSTTNEVGSDAKAAIGISVTVIILILLAFLALGIPHIRSRRRTRALQRAVEEVERGVELQKTVGHGSEATSEWKDNMVLESRVEIVVDDGHSERNAVEAWDGWNATWNEDDDLERGRKGMSLPRREY